MGASESWQIAVAGYAVLLAWPITTVVLVWFALRYHGTHRAKTVNRSVAGGNGRPEHFWIIVPALNEEAVVANTVGAALKLRGPAGTLSRVLVVDDGSDDRTPEVLAAIDHPRLHILRRELPAARQGKGEALNAAYRHISMLTEQAGMAPEKVVAGIIDGDGQGSENILVEISRLMRDERIGAAQVQVRIRNRNRLLGAVQDLEFGAIVDACQNMRDALDTVGLGGNGQFSRLSTLQALGAAPWSSCLVEDMELGLRMHLNGVGIRYTSRASVTQQAVVDIRRLTRQRTRWAQGNMQCARYVGRLFSSPRVARIALAEMLHYLLSPWANAMVTVLLIGTGIAGFGGLLIGHPLVFIPTWEAMAVSFGLWLGVTTFPGLLWAAVHQRKHGDEGMTRMLMAALAYPAFLILGLAATYRALGRQASGRQSWAKTERLVEEPLALAA
ncbi:glycosyltransferase family 2 protein [Actinoplanes derwentensis]|uniref:Glycosyltransferase, catalytic subunit of cellulose synthase and poly-beta-1,6-N-acetylglucosamine synthase n=1 Tax=Actinoplanes derwentensis TaxID=113562 RepID=A0A1H2CXT7_9ACTN|nr:glycosyltransferase [Actinoplanes derwentensis]GID82816.1 N-acetyl-glucosamine transferase [Actinoplanes derwentensis]SDT75109.1 Glycosyltransferase, catalytic subunit of cellulose synthase and poly-beta-1,6-N-acetylglucosamine synthase [Actinoplanes derwentensis]